MTTIHMDTDQVREKSSQMNQWADDLLSSANRLNTAASRLSNVWHGNEAEAFTGNLRAWVRKFISQADQLQTLATRTAREADEWESIDNQSQFRKIPSLTGEIGPGGAATSPDNPVYHTLPYNPGINNISNLLKGAGYGLDTGALGIAIGLMTQLASLGKSAAQIEAALDADPLLKDAGIIGSILAIASGAIDFINMFISDLNRYSTPQEIVAAAIVDARFVEITTSVTLVGDTAATGLIYSGIGETLTGGGALVGLPSIFGGALLYSGISEGVPWATEMFPTSSLHDWLVQQEVNSLPSGSGLVL